MQPLSNFKTLCSSGVVVVVSGCNAVRPELSMGWVEILFCFRWVRLVSLEMNAWTTPCQTKYNVLVVHLGVSNDDSNSETGLSCQ